MTDSELINALRDSVRIDMLSATMYYGFNKWKLQKEHHSILEDMALEVLNNPNLTIMVDSYCDTIGTEQNNSVVVFKRAEQVKNHLVTFGVSENNISIKLHGEKDALYSNDADNRRTVVRFKRD
jgi:peptidoglycan-associated lipoprotein